MDSPTTALGNSGYQSAGDRLDVSCDPHEAFGRTLSLDYGRTRPRSQPSKPIGPALATVQPYTLAPRGWVNPPSVSSLGLENASTLIASRRLTRVSADVT